MNFADMTRPQQDYFRAWSDTCAPKRHDKEAYEANIARRAALIDAMTMEEYSGVFPAVDAMFNLRLALYRNVTAHAPQYFIMGTYRDGKGGKFTTNINIEPYDKARAERGVKWQRTDGVEDGTYWLGERVASDAFYNPKTGAVVIGVRGAWAVAAWEEFLNSWKGL